jgi:hypothetical protein
MIRQVKYLNMKNSPLIHGSFMTSGGRKLRVSSYELRAGVV